MTIVVGFRITGDTVVNTGDVGDAPVGMSQARVAGLACECTASFRPSNIIWLAPREGVVLGTGGMLTEKIAAMTMASLYM
jgi:hypothetical protein